MPPGIKSSATDAVGPWSLVLGAQMGRKWVTNRSALDVVGHKWGTNGSALDENMLLSHKSPVATEKYGLGSCAVVICILFQGRELHAMFDAM